MKTLKVTITFKRGLETVAVVEGEAVPAEGVSVQEVTSRIIEVEQYLERLTGLRVHITPATE